PRAIGELARGAEQEVEASETRAARDVEPRPRVAFGEPDRRPRPDGPELIGRERDDVHDAEEGVGAVQGGRGPADDLDLVYRLERYELDAQPVAGRAAVRDRAAVEHHLDHPALGAGTARHAATTRVRQEVAVDEIETD